MRVCRFEVSLGRAAARLAIFLAGVGLVAADAGAGPGERAALWSVVQACKLNHRITGGAFPCLDVVEQRGTENGYAVIRAPVDEVKVIVTPTVRTIGVEALRLRGPAAPNYFQYAWTARHFATDGLATTPPPGDIALAVNSKEGRSQDQLHIHVACIRQDVKRELALKAADIRSHAWFKLKPMSGSPAYAARWVPGDLGKVNVFDLVAEGLKITPDQMERTTIVVVGGTQGFTILARQRLPHSYDEGHGEYLLDQVCAPFRGS